MTWQTALPFIDDALENDWSLTTIAAQLDVASSICSHVEISDV
jgi:hypothetical protein